MHCENQDKIVSLGLSLFLEFFPYQKLKEWWQQLPQGLLALLKLVFCYSWTTFTEVFEFFKVWVLDPCGPGIKPNYTSTVVVDKSYFGAYICQSPWQVHNWGQVWQSDSLDWAVYSKVCFNWAWWIFTRPPKQAILLAGDNLIDAPWLSTLLFTIWSCLAYGEVHKETKWLSLQCWQI